MLIRNLTQGNLNLKGLSGTKIVLPPLKVVEIDSLDFPADRIKKLFGKYVHILTEKLEEGKDVPTKPKENLESKEGKGTVPAPLEAVTENEENKNISDEGNDTDANTEDVVNDLDNVDELVDEVLEEIEEESEPKEEKVTKSTKKSRKSKK